MGSSIFSLPRKKLFMSLGGYRQIPKITHSRPQLFYNRKEFESGAQCIFLSSDTYPDLFQLKFPDIVGKSPKGWRQKTDSSNQKYLWFPPGALSDDDISKIDNWGNHFKQYVLLGLNDNIRGEFSDELDFCMALDFNKNSPNSQRTSYGEAEYQLKFHRNDLSEDDRKRYAKQLLRGMLDGYDNLPIISDNLYISTIPADSAGQKKLAWRLAKNVAKIKSIDFLSTTLTCNRKSLKNLHFGEKLEEWESIFSDDNNINLSYNVQDKTIVVVDDLYQSGTSMWSYAKHLKSKGAKYVIGLVCVKSLRDSDNQ